MKNIYTILIMALLLTACKSEEKLPENVKALTDIKTKLKTQIDSLTVKLKEVEGKLAEFDTTKRLKVVTAFVAKESKFKHYVEMQGTVQAEKSIEIHPEMGGTVRAILVSEGQKVRKGQTLVRLDQTVYDNNIQEVKTQLAFATTTFERQERLWSQKIGSEMQFLQAKNQKEGLERSLSTLYAQANKMKIIAPFSGTVDEIFPKTGELTSPQAPVLRLVNLNNVYVEADVTETYLKQVKKGTETIVNFPSLGMDRTAKISQVGNFINPNNRSFKVKINLDNRDNSIKPNLLADIKIRDFEAEGIVLPATLVQEDQNGDNFVFVLSKHGKAYKVEKRTIKTGKEYNHQVFVESGLKADDMLVDEGARFVINGDEVSLKK